MWIPGETKRCGHSLTEAKGRTAMMSWRGKGQMPEHSPQNSSVPLSDSLTFFLKDKAIVQP
jgi:hypothetical protein